jgi:hypothetical protein
MSLIPDEQTHAHTLNPSFKAETKYNERRPRVGQSILFFANSDDAIALSNGKKMGDPVAAIVTQVWSPITVNLKLIPDHAAMQDRGSVTHKSAMGEGGGYYWLFPEEYYL